MRLRQLRITISIHALREEGDAKHRSGVPSSSQDFYPRPPRGGRRDAGQGNSRGNHISIHALREEGDEPAQRPRRAVRYFYPRPPRGGRLGAQSVIAVGFGISIHALREEGDVRAVERAHLCKKFLSTPSARRATLPGTTLRRPAGRFLSTPSARRATYRLIQFKDYKWISIHALREEGDL